MEPAVTKTKPNPQSEYTRFVGKYVTGRGSVSDPIKYIYF